MQDCEKTFLTKGNLLRHKKNIHKIYDNTNTITNAKTNTISTDINYDNVINNDNPNFISIINPYHNHNHIDILKNSINSKP